MSPTPEASERQRKAAFKAWETIRRKQAEQEAKVTSAGIGGVTKVITSSVRATSRTKKRGYAKNWKQIVAEIRIRARVANGLEQCECRGECQKHRGRCEEINHTWAKHRRREGKVKIRFTTAHLCHSKGCSCRAHLRAMCEPCHLIYDLRCRQQGLCGERAVRWAMQQGVERPIEPWEYSST
jgi:hypothetical protein